MASSVRWSLSGPFYESALDALDRSRKSQLGIQCNKAKTAVEADWALALFARWCAFQVLELWQPTSAVRDFLRLMPQSRALDAWGAAGEIYEKITETKYHDEAAAEACLAAAISASEKKVWIAAREAAEYSARAVAFHMDPQDTGTAWEEAQAYAFGAQLEVLTRLFSWVSCCGSVLSYQDAPINEEQRSDFAIAVEMVLAGRRAPDSPPDWIVSFSGACFGV